MKNRTPLLTLTLLGLALAGCSKHSPETTSTRQAASVTNTTLASEPIDTNRFRLVRKIVIKNPATATSNDLGVIDVSSGKPSPHTLADGRVCTITPTILPNGNVSLNTSIVETNGSTTRSRTLTFEAPADGRAYTFGFDNSTAITVALRK